MHVTVCLRARGIPRRRHEALPSVLTVCPAAWRSDSRSVVMGASAAAGAAMTRKVPCGSSPCDHSDLDASLSRRRTRFRTTALPTLREIAYATAGRDAPGRSRRTTWSGPCRPRARELRNWPKTARSVTLSTDAVAASGRQTMTALAATGLDDGLPGAVRHAVTEAVLAGAATGLGLVGALHENSVLSGTTQGRPAVPDGRILTDVHPAAPACRRSPTSVRRDPRGAGA